MGMGFQFFGVQDKWDGVWSKLNFLDFEAHRSFHYVYVFLLCKEFVDAFVDTWIPMFCRWVELLMFCYLRMIIVDTDLGMHDIFDLSLINANMITSEHLMC
jgi:hypothetical protein